MKVLGLDPASKCGFAWSDGTTTVSGVWPLFSGNKPLDLHERIVRLHRERGIDAIAAEDASFGSFNQATAAAHNELKGAIRMAATLIEVDTPTFYKPSSIKKYATGCGTAKKDQLMRACELILKIKPKCDNEGDALWIMHMRQHNYTPPAQAERDLLKRIKKDTKKQPRLF